jgi:hypothetical protein
MNTDLRANFREERVRRFKWRTTSDILALCGTAIVVGFAVYAVLMVVSGA